MNEQARRAIVSYTTYQEAERAVDHLSDQGFPVERVAFIGQDVRPVEQRTGGMGPGEAVLHGTVGGGVPGALIGGTFGPLNWLDPVGSGLLPPCTGWFSGALVGALLGLPVPAAQRGRRDFASVSFVQPGRYADDAVPAESARLPAELPSGTGAGARSGAWRGGRPKSGPAVT